MNGLLSNNKIDSYKLDGSSGGTFQIDKVKPPLGITAFNKPILAFQYCNMGSSPNYNPVVIQSDGTVVWLNATSKTINALNVNAAVVKGSFSYTQTVQSLAIDDNDNIYIGTFQGGIWKVNAAMTTNTQIISNFKVVTFMTVRGGFLYVGYSDGTAEKYDLSGTVVWSVTLSAAQINCGAVDSQGNFYYGAGTAFWKLAAANGSTIIAGDTTLAKNINCMAFDSNDDLYFTNQNDGNICKSTKASNYSMATFAWTLSGPGSISQALCKTDVDEFYTTGGSTGFMQKFNKNGTWLSPSWKTNNIDSGFSPACAQPFYRNGCMAYMVNVAYSADTARPHLKLVLEKITA